MQRIKMHIFELQYKTNRGQIKVKSIILIHSPLKIFSLYFSFQMEKNRRKLKNILSYIDI